MSKKKKVLMVSPKYRPSIGGIEMHVEKLANVLDQKGFNVEILTSSHKFGLKLYERVGHSSIQRIPYGWDKNPFLVPLWILNNLRSFSKNDIVHVHDPVALVFWCFPLLLFKQRKHVFATFHGYEQDPVPWFFKILRRIARKLSHRVICIGDFIENTYRIPCDTMLTGAVETMNVQIDTRDGIVFVGRVESDTGIIAYLDALKHLELNYGIRTHLTVCGRGILESDLRNRAEEIFVDLRLKGLIEAPYEIVASAQLCFAGGYLSILEAMSLGVPVIALAQTELKWNYYLSMRNAGGPISIQTTPEGVAREANRILTNHHLYKYISSEGKRFASTMTWEKLATKYTTLWKNGRSNT
ncbi:MAG: glycosyltransferase family 4 protein [Candidatus Thorarchaeota archaeon]